MAPPRLFNDPFDCRIGWNFQLLDTPEKRLQYTQKVAYQNAHRLIAYRRDPEQDAIEFVQRLESNLDGVQKHFDEMLEKNDERLGVISFADHWDSILMWSHYADNHKGYCLGFDEEKMRNSGLFGKGGRVIYQDRFPAISPLDEFTPELMFIQAHTKAKEWSYEREYRLSTLYESPASNGQRVVKVPSSFMTEVVIGLAMPEDHIQQILAAAKAQCVPAYQAYKVPFEFRIGRKLIQTP